MNSDWNTNDETTLTLPVPLDSGPRRWMLAVAAVAIFTCGTVVGGIVATPNKPPAKPANTASKAKRPELAVLVTRQIDSKLKLSAEQKQTVMELVRVAERDLKATRRKQLEELTPRLLAFASAVDQVLTPAQAKIWKRFSKQQFDKIKRGEPAVNQFLNQAL